jgi:hypothetical protein
LDQELLQLVAELLLGALLQLLLRQRLKEWLKGFLQGGSVEPAEAVLRALQALAAVLEGSQAQLEVQELREA